MNQNRGHEEVERRIIDACVQCAKIKGYSDACGVLRGTLFLADQPMSLDDLVARTGYSKSTVCLNMNLMENLGLAKRVVIPGDKRSRYATVSDPNLMKAILLANIEKEVHIIYDALDHMDRDLRTYNMPAENIQAKIASLKHSYEQIDKLLGLISKFAIDELIELLSKPH
jgi:DNA-binding transcriptional regulator GbsR (MarR family)